MATDLELEVYKAELEFAKVQKATVEKERELAQIEEELGYLSNLRDKLVVRFLELRIEELESKIRKE